MAERDGAFAGRRVLVSGAGKGIGRATARLLASRGAEIVAISRDAGDLETLRAEIGGLGVAVDLEDAAATGAVVAGLLPIDLVVNCAGIVTLESFLDTATDSFDRVMAVNVRAPMVIAQGVARDLIARGRPGAIVNVSSLAAAVGTPDHTAYCASKAALDAMTRVMARELGPHGIRTNSVNPVVTLTPMAEKAWSDPAKAGPMLARIPLGRFAAVEDVAAAIAFLLSDEAAMINGICLTVDGGFSAG
jgi:NAD(P)-dependent dehydrogenase (short-subunit alcohol dehydrogenase family)